MLGENNKQNNNITHWKKQQTKYHLADRHVIFTTYCKTCKIKKKKLCLCSFSFTTNSGEIMKQIVKML